MIQINVYRRSPTRAHAVATHVDYHRWPSRSWDVLAWDVNVPVGTDPRSAVLETARALIGHVERLAGDERVAADGEQLELLSATLQPLL